MKKLALIFALHTCCNIGYAQTSELSVGFSFGPNIVNLVTRSDIQQAFKPNNRLYSSVNIEYRVGRNWYVQADLAYELKGTKMPGMIFYDSLGNTTGEVSFYMNYGYMTLPVLLNYKFTVPVMPEHSFRVTVGAGGYGGLLINRAERIKGYNIKDSLLYRGIVYDDKLDFGLSLNAGIEYPVSKRISINTRVLLNYGIHNIISKPQLNNIHPSYDVSRNRALNFLIGAKYSFDTKKKQKRS